MSRSPQRSHCGVSAALAALAGALLGGAGALGSDPLSLPVRLATALGLEIAAPGGGGSGSGGGSSSSDGERDALELRLVFPPLPPVAALAFVPAPGDRLLATGSYGGVVLWDLAAAAPRLRVSFPGTVHAVAFEPRGTRFAIGGGEGGDASGFVAIHEAHDGRLVRRFEAHDDAVLDLAFSADGARLATAGYDRRVRVWDLEREELALSLEEHSDAVYCVRFVDGRNLLASAGADRAIKLSDIDAGRVVRSITVPEEAILALAVSPDGATLVAAGKDPALRVFRIADGEAVRTLRGHDGWVEAITFSPDGARVASAGSDRRVRLWDAAEGKRLDALEESSEWVYAVAFDPTGSLLAAGSWDGTVRLHDAATGALLATLLHAPPPAAEEGAGAGDDGSDASAPQWAIVGSDGSFQASERALERATAGPRDGSAAWGPIPLRTLVPRLHRPAALAARLRGEESAPPSLEGLARF